MGNYNPSAPVIIGEEWVPILYRPYEHEYRLERGHGFTLPVQTQVAAMGVYIEAPHPQPIVEQVVFGSVYQRGEETNIGPIRKVKLPISPATATSLSGDVTVFIDGQSAAASSHYDAVELPNDNSWIRFDGSGNAWHSFFTVDLVSSGVLAVNKRILAVRVLYTVGGTAFPLPPTASFSINLSTSDDSSALTRVGTVKYENITNGAALLEQSTIRKSNLGEVTPFWAVGPTNGVMDATRMADTYPWRYEEILRFDSAGTTLLGVDIISTGIDSGYIDVGYVALEIIYCDENRVGYGGRQLAPKVLSEAGAVQEWLGNPYFQQASYIPLLSPSDLDPVVLPPGDYTYTVRLAPARVALQTGTRALQEACQQLYEITPHPGVEITVPVTETDTCVATPSNVMPHLTLHSATPDVVDDTFTRVVADSWGTADTGQTWSQAGGTSAADFNVDGTMGMHTVNTTVTQRLTYIEGLTQFSTTRDAFDGDVYVEVQTSALAAGSFLDCTIHIRGTGGTVHAGIRFDTTQAIIAAVFNGSTSVPVATATTGFTHVINTAYSIRLRVLSGVWSLKIWPTAGIEPSGWQLTVDDISQLNINGIKNFGCRSRRNGGNTNNVTVSWDNFNYAPIRTIDEVHVYGKQLIASSYDNDDVDGTFSFPVQDIIQASGGGVVDYRFARFYARRFGTQATRLWFSDVSVTYFADISSADFDALPEIVDGWKEVTVEFATPVPIDDSQTDAGFVWFVEPDPFTGVFSVNAANRWEILVASAPAQMSFIDFDQIDSNHGQTLTYGTYGGQDAIFFISDFDTGGNSFPWADAALMLSTGAPTVSGFALTTETQAVTGIGVECVDPTCVPDGISYHNLTWSPVATGGDINFMASGFGEYEIQRSDDVDDTWHTIAHIECIDRTTFNDYEARIGVASHYRIRAMTHLYFEGPWSAVITGTLPAPGVTGSSVDNGILIFTSNERQSGSLNLAYAMTWETGNVSEQFDFIESSEVQLQRMYNRDYQVAFRPLERGGESFSRTLLVQAAAIALPRLGNFHSLRDMAWDTVPYICVRDELGDRWLATVQIPDGTVRRNRRLYMARVDITEVTDIPSPVTLDCH